MKSNYFKARCRMFGNDLTSLEQLRRWVDIVTAVLGVVTATLVVLGRWPLGSRISKLQAEQKAALQAQLSGTAAAMANLEGRIQPQALSRSQINQLTVGLAQVDQSVSVEIITLESRGVLTEACELFAAQLAEVFQAKGWSVSFDHERSVPDHGLQLKLTINTPQEPALPPKDQAIIDAFAHLGIPFFAAYESDPKALTTELQIVVGLHLF